MVSSPIMPLSSFFPNRTHLPKAKFLSWSEFPCSVSSLIHKHTWCLPSSVQFAECLGNIFTTTVFVNITVSVFRWSKPWWSLVVQQILYSYVWVSWGHHYDVPHPAWLKTVQTYPLSQFWRPESKIRCPQVGSLRRLREKSVRSLSSSFWACQQLVFLGL